MSPLYSRRLQSPGRAKTLPQLLRATSFALLLSASISAPALALEAHPIDTVAPRTYHIAPGPLGRVLSGFALDAGLALSFNPALTEGQTSKGLDGNYSARDAINRLLDGSTLMLVELDNGGYTLKKQPAAAPTPAADAATLPLVKVEAAAQRDPTSEGTGSYITPAITLGLGEHSVRETPNSVSVVTRQRIEDQGFVRLEDAMQYTTAMKVTTYGTNSSAIESRGYTIDHYQIDGVSSSARVYENNFGLAMYDRIEVWRGPTGLLQGSGDPGGTLNFVRKRAEPVLAANAHAAVGSWDNYYSDVDLTGPLTEDARLRGRLVASYQDRGYFTDYAASREPMIYATLEFDITDNVTVSIGNTWQQNKTLPFFGLPIDSTGHLPDVSRSTYVGASWAHTTQQANRSFVELEDRLANGGTVKLDAVYLARKNDGEIAWGSSLVDPASGNFELIPYFSMGRERELNLNAQITQPFTLWNLKQEWVAGANYQRLASTNAYNSSTWGQNGFVQDIFAPDVNVAKPDVAIDAPSHAAQKQSALFGQLRIKPIEPLTLLLGGRLAWFKSEDLDHPGNDLTENGKFIPYTGVVYDVSPQWSVYGSFSDIFAPQSDIDSAGHYLPARKGKQYEVGVKGEHLNGKLDSSLAFYRIEDTNRAMSDPANPDFSIASGKVRSQGIEAELTGHITAQWNVTTGYGFNTAKQITAAPGQEGEPFNTTFPKHTFSLWSDYRTVAPNDHTVTLGGGMRYRSSIYNEDSGIRVTQGGFTLFAVQAGYYITPKVLASLTINNLFDKKYLDRPEAWTRQNYFGEPRSFMLNVGWKL